MALLKYPERLLQPFPSLNRFAQELYAMFRVSGDATDIAPAAAADEPGKPRPEGQRLARDPSRVKPVEIPAPSPWPARATPAGLSDRRPEPPRATPAEAARRTVEQVLDDRRRAAAEPLRPPEPTARTRTREVTREVPQATRREVPDLPAPPRGRRSEAAEGGPLPEAVKRSAPPAGPERRPRREPPAVAERKARREPAPAPEAPPRRREPPGVAVEDTAPAKSREPDPFPTLPLLGGNYPFVAGGGGVPIFVGRVVSHSSGQPAQCHLFGDGPESPPNPADAVAVKIPTLRDGESLPPDLWLFNVFEFSDNDGNAIYYAQPPVWVA